MYLLSTTCDIFAEAATKMSAKYSMVTFARGNYVELGLPAENFGQKSYPAYAWYK